MRGARLSPLLVMIVGCSSRTEAPVPPAQHRSDVLATLSHATVLPSGGSLRKVGDRFELERAPIATSPWSIARPALHVTLPSSAEQAVHLEVAGRADLSIDSTAEDVIEHAKGDINGSAIVHHAVRPDHDLARILEPTRVEELRLVRKPAAEITLKYRLVAGAGIARLELRDGIVHALDTAGHTQLQTEPAIAVDATGQHRPLTAKLDAVGEQYRLTYTLDARELAAPIAIDPAWTAGPYRSGRRAQALATLPSGRVLASGGLTPTGAVEISAAIFGEAGGFYTTRDSGQARDSHTATWIPSISRVLVAAGSPTSLYNSTCSVAELFDPTAIAFTTTTSSTAEHSSHTATLLGTSKVLIVGSGPGSMDNHAEVFDAATKTWSKAGTVITPRRRHIAAVLASGKVLVAGGEKPNFFDGGAVDLSSAEVYDPAMNTWTAVASMGVARNHMAAAVLDDGRVLVAGGQTFTAGNLSTAEIYDPVANTWTATPAMAAQHWDSTATKLPTGRVLVVGGGTNLTELYDPSTAKWLRAGNLKTARSVHAAFLTGAGKVYVTGGPLGGDDQEEIFDPVANGAACTYEGECTSRSCVNNTCCASASCPAGQTCAGPAAPGVCRKVDGQTCSAGTECGSGFCIDGVCCNAPCGGQCEACNITGSIGSCVSVPSGQAPATSRAACAGTGVCQGKCGGVDRTKCTLFAGSSVICSMATCSTATTAASAAGCNGAGACSTPVTTDCGKYACDTTSTTCKTTCTKAEDCAPSYGCMSSSCQKGALGGACTAGSECASGFCVDGVCCGASSCPSGFVCNAVGKLGSCARALGAKCADGPECGSGSCVDGVCCDSACSGQCEACDVAGKVGTCSPATGAPHGTRITCAGSGACAGSCDGTLRDACSFPTSATSCAPAKCDGSKLTPESKCDGAGGCKPQEDSSCIPFACVGTACKTTCSADSDCASGFRCTGGACVQGATCSDDKLSSIAKDGSPTTCAPFRCGSDGNCASTCNGTADCTPGFVCETTTSKCVAAPADTSDDGGCSVHSGASRGSAAAGLVLLALIGTRRRARR